MTTETQTTFEMRSRVARTSSDSDRKTDIPSYRDVVLIERKIKPGDTLNRLAIQYAVHAADIKRVNNLVSDVDFGALTSIKIPITRMRHALGVNGSSDEDEHIIDVDERAHLLLDRSRDASVEEIFRQADSVIAQARETLPEDGIPGTFHFIDARPPDSGCSVWALLAGVVIMFMIVPLLLTFYEESDELNKE
ncbi:unnamed protein product [Auanema sp. JU1783]|nr:unnamed protein product [Auanema sp. JU1783]